VFKLDFTKAKEAIRERIDIVDLIGKTIELKCVGDLYIGRCPFPHGYRNGVPIYDKKPSLTVYPHNQTYYCYGCEAGDQQAVNKGSCDIFGWIQNLLNIGFREAVIYLGEKVGIQVDKPSVQVSEPALKSIAEVTEKNRFFYTCLLKNKEALAYLKNRNIQDQTMVLGRMGYVPKDYSHQSVANRIAFGITDILSENIATVGMGYRVLDNSLPKYRNDPTTEFFNKRTLLYLFPEALGYIKKERSICLVEGYFDALRLHQAGIKWTSALMGKSLTTEHIKKFKQHVSNVYLWLDGDYSGKNATMRMLPALVGNKTNIYIININGCDPDDIITRLEDVADFIQTNAVPAVTWAIDYSTVSYRQCVINERIKAWNMVIPIINALSDSSEKTAYESYVKNILNIA
jgi:DNA primase